MPTTPPRRSSTVTGRYRRGTAGAALRHRDFRLVWGGTFLSNIGTWMQNVSSASSRYKISGKDAGYVGLLYFAQLGPLLFLSQIGGVIADQVDRRRFLVTMQTMQMALSFLLVPLAVVDHPNQTAIFLCVLAIGIFNALNAPAMGAILPTLVPREDLPGAVSLQSVQMNLSRVIGSAIGGVLYAVLGIGWVFAINAATYVFAVAGLVLARYDARNPNPVRASRSRRCSRACGSRGTTGCCDASSSRCSRSRSSASCTWACSPTSPRRTSGSPTTTSSRTGCSTAPGHWAPRSARSPSARSSPTTRRR